MVSGLLIGGLTACGSTEVSPAPKKPDATVVVGPTGGHGDTSKSTLAGRYFTGEGAYGDDTSLGYDYGVWFLQDGWAYWGRPKAGMPHCTKVTGKPSSDDLAQGQGCVHYTYDDGTVTVGRLKGEYSGDSVDFGDQALWPEAIPKAGERLEVDLSETGYNNCGDLFGENCSTWTTYFKMTKDGHFALSDTSLTTWGDAVGDYGSVSKVSPEDRGTYQILDGGRVKLTYASGKTEVRTLAEHVDEKGDPDPAGRTDAGGVILGTTDFSA